jgi:hypothetical protein
MGRTYYLKSRFEEMLQYLYKNKPPHKVKVGTVVSKVNISDILNIGRLLFKTSEVYKPDVWRVYQFEPVERGEDNKEKYQISNEEFFDTITKLRTEFPEANIFPRANSDHNNAYFFISPDGMLQLVDNRHRSVLDVTTADTDTIINTIKHFNKTIKKNEANREWFKD